MKTVIANMLTYDADVGRIEPGERYWLEDDKADRWAQAGIATLAPAEPEPIPAEPEPLPSEPVEEEEDEDSEEATAEHIRLRTEVHRLSNEEGLSQRAIAEQLGISRQRVRDLLHT